MPLTEDLTFKLGDNGIVLNTDTSSMPFVDIKRVVGLDSAPFRETQRDHEGTDGGFMDAEFETGRPIILEGDVYAAAGQLEAYLDNLKDNYAPSATLVPFYFKSPGINERVLFVKPRGCRYDWQTLRRLGNMPIQFSMFAEDPRMYDTTLTTTVIQLGAQVFTGFGFNFGFNFGFGGTSSTTDGATVTNNGNRTTPVVFEIAGPVTDPQIHNDTTDDVMQFSITLSSTDILIIDTQYKTVTLNGVNRRSALLQPNWIQLAKGDNFIRYRATSSDPSTLTVKFRSAWR